jgi:ATP-dependent Lon protease
VTSSKDLVRGNIKEEMPLVERDELNMILPGCTVSLLFRTKNEQEIFIKSRGLDGESYAFLIIMSPGAKKGFIKTPVSRIGVVCSVYIDLERNHILFEGMYRARILGTELKRSPHNKLACMVKLSPVEDVNKVQHFLDNKSAVMDRMIDNSKLLVDIAQMMLEIDSTGEDKHNIIDLLNLAKGITEVDASDIYSVDGIIWYILFSISFTTKIKYKQRFLDSNNLLARIDGCSFFLGAIIQELGERAANPDATANEENSKESEVDEVDIVNTDEIDEKKLGQINPDIKRRWKQFIKIKKHMNDDAKKVVAEDLKRLMRTNSVESEWTKFVERLDFNLGLPWGTISKQEDNISEVERVLEDDHAHLEKVKELICDFVAPEILGPASKGPILCFVGPPGVGKTSLAKSIAKALKRKFIRISVGGMRDEADVRGHRVTYLGSKPGRILTQIRRCGAKNPVFVFDEIDKMGYDSVKGDISSSMLEVLDPEQNHSFTDHYLDAHFDLSLIFFICTANSKFSIHPALLDRMHIIRLPGYLEYEKVDIARKFLLSKCLKESGLIDKRGKALVAVTWDDGALLKVIRGYTREAGVRNLERAISTVSRKITRKYLCDKIDKFHVTSDALFDLLGPEKFSKKPVRKTEIGEAIGLVWTEVGGDIIFVQVELYPSPTGEKTLSQTGQLGDVLREADKVALTLIRNKLEGNKYVIDKLKTNFIHLHIPDGAAPKDGPSAGITTFIALYSELTNQPVKELLAMTGEITLKGHVTEVGGIREKIVAAYNAGLREVMLPKDNEDDLNMIPESIKEKLTFYFIETIDEALQIAFPQDSA